MHTCMHACVRACMHACMHGPTYMEACMHADLHYAYAYTLYVCIYIYMYTYLYVCMYVYMYVCQHTFLRTCFCKHVCSLSLHRSIIASVASTSSLHMCFGLIFKLQSQRQREAWGENLPIGDEAIVGRCNEGVSPAGSNTLRKPTQSP